MTHIELKPNNPPREPGSYIAQLTTLRGRAYLGFPRLVRVEPELPVGPRLVALWENRWFPVEGLPLEPGVCGHPDDGIMWSDPISIETALQTPEIA